MKNSGRSVSSTFDSNDVHRECRDGDLRGNLSAHRLHFSNRLTQRLEDLQAPHVNASLETRCCQLRDVVHSTAMCVLGCVRRQHQDWFDENDAAIRNPLAERNSLHIAYLSRPTDSNKAASYECRRLAQQRLQQIQDAGMARTAEDIQGCTDRNEKRNYFVAIKAIYGPPT
nr:unnamed protein product [Spirometra erinaceieuropaei]